MEAIIVLSLIGLAIGLAFRFAGIRPPTKDEVDKMWREAQEGAQKKRR